MDAQKGALNRVETGEGVKTYKETMHKKNKRCR